MDSLDALPYIDPDFSQAQRDAANALIRRELPKGHATTLHPSLSPISPSRLTPTLQQEVERAGAGTPRVGGIDLARYESSQELSPDTSVEIMKAALRTAYSNITFLRNRQMNIDLLEEYGKNAWLIGNSQLEDVHNRIEAELTSVKDQVEATNRIRKAVQEDSRGELLGLAETWSRGIDTIVRTQIATESMKQHLMQKRKYTIQPT